MLQSRKPRVWIQSHGRQLAWLERRACAVTEPQIYQHLAQRSCALPDRQEVIAIVDVLLDQMAQALQLARKLLVRLGYRQELV